MEEVGRDGVFRRASIVRDVQVESDVDWLDRQTFGEDRHALGAFDVTDERRVGFDRVEVSGAEPEDADVGIRSELDSQIEVGWGAPVVVEDLELDVLVAVPSSQLVRARALHVGGHVLADLAGDHAAVGLDGSLADDRRHHRRDDRIEERRVRLLEDHFEGEVVDHRGLGNHVAENSVITFWKIHGHGAGPRELHGVGGQRIAVVEDHALANREGVGQQVLRNESVLHGRNFGGESRDRIGAHEADLEQPLVGLEDHGLAALSRLHGCRVQGCCFIVGGMDEDPRVAHLAGGLGSGCGLSSGRGSGGGRFAGRGRGGSLVGIRRAGGGDQRQGYEQDDQYSGAEPATLTCRSHGAVPFAPMGSRWAHLSSRAVAVAPALLVGTYSPGGSPCNRL